MNEATNTPGNYYRIIAFWAICEGFAGGILHASHMPFSGLIISSFSTLCIIMLSKFCKGSWHIAKATLLVCVFKLMLSPHTPPTAYLAVGFQGLVGQLVFWRSFNKTGSYILAILALVESSIQKLLVMVLIYGKPFWKAVDDFIKRLIGIEDDGTNYVNLLALGYVLIHFIAGIFIGWVAIFLVKHVKEWRKQNPEIIFETTGQQTSNHLMKQSRGRIWMMVSFCLLLGLYLQSKMDPTNAILPTGKILDIFLRAFLVLGFWLFIFSPFIQWLIVKYLNKWAKGQQGEIQSVLELVPEMKGIFVESIKKSKRKNGTISTKYFLKSLMVNVLK